MSETQHTTTDDEIMREAGRVCPVCLGPLEPGEEGPECDPDWGCPDRYDAREEQP